MPSSRRGETLKYTADAANKWNSNIKRQRPVQISHRTLPYIQFLRQYRIILSADTASEVRQMLSQKRR